SSSGYPFESALRTGLLRGNVGLASIPTSRYSQASRDHFLVIRMATPHDLAVNRLHASFIPPMELAFDSATPLYRQISSWFQRSILSGQLQPGQRVPSTRALAKALRISRIPVLGAYELLIAEGYFHAYSGAGTCVSRSVPDPFLRPARDQLLDHIPIALDSRTGRTPSRRATGMRGPAPASLRTPRSSGDLEHFPIGTWAKLVRRHADSISNETMGYGEPMGYWPFREAVAEYLGASRAVKCHPTQVLVTTGSQQALQISALALLDPGDRAWIEEPGYPGTVQALRAASATVVRVPVDQQGMDVAHGIRAAGDARAAYVTPAHQYPMSVAMSSPRRIELLSWAARRGAWIVEDDNDSEYRFATASLASLQGHDRNGRVIYVGTLAKVMFPTLRLGFVVVPEDLVDSFLDVRNAIDTACTSVLYQMAMTDFIREGHFSRHITRMRAVYTDRRGAMVEALRTLADGLLEVAGDCAGLYVLARLPPGVDDAKLADAAAQMGLPVTALSRCFMNPPPDGGGLLLHYSNVSAAEIPAYVRSLKALILCREARAAMRPATLKAAALNGATATP
ncbi:MAG TPA: PLP-dependent aminotransferase family protein, partial [Ktedonobacterales bacterium]|nr:PLP-dependent aminotransferase family protein [Ktedonobacterales bacterium]